MSRKKNKLSVWRYHRELVGLIGRIAADRRLLDDFLADLLTPSEYEKIATRWQIVRQLDQDTPQRDIIENLEVAGATVTRGARMLLNQNGGFHKVLRKITP